MAFASHLGPWLLGTVKNTTGTTAGTIRNMGATEVAQQVVLPYTALTGGGTGNAFVLPAGALITSISFYTTTTFSSAATVKLTIGSTDIVAATTVTGPAAPTAMTSATAADGTTALWANVGSSDAIVTYTGTGTSLTAGSVTLVIRYIVRNSDGSANPTYSQA
jgi:hypothetical protein